MTALEHPRDDAPHPGTRPDRIPRATGDETALLALALHSAEARELVAELTPASFYRPLWRTVAALFVEYRDAGIPLTDDLLRMELEDAGHDANLVANAHRELLLAAPSSAAAPKYAERIADAHYRRTMLGLLQELELATFAGDRAAQVELRGRISALEPVIGAGGLPIVNIAAIIDQRAPKPTFLARRDGEALFYEASINYLHGEPSKGKSWVAQIAAKEALELGWGTIIVDFEDTARGWVNRLRTLGTERDLLVDRLIYVDQPTRDGIPERLLADVRYGLENGPVLVIVDGISALMAASDLDEQDSSETNLMFDRWLTPVARAGATIIAVDHVTKSKEGRGLWPRGSGAKRARIDGAAYLVDSSAHPFNRTTAGRIRLTLAKDRHGGIDAVEGATAASIYVEPHFSEELGGRLDYTIDAPVVDADKPSGDPAAIREAGQVRALRDAIPQALEATAKALSYRDLRTILKASPWSLRFANDALSIAATELAHEGTIELYDGPRGSKMHRLPPREVPLLHDSLSEPTP